MKITDYSTTLITSKLKVKGKVKVNESYEMTIRLPK